MFEKLLPYEAAYLILDSYIHYHHQFKRITKRAKIRFELRDWHGIQNDTRERLTLYRDAVGNATEQVAAFQQEVAIVLVGRCRLRSGEAGEEERKAGDLEAQDRRAEGIAAQAGRKEIGMMEKGRAETHPKSLAKT